VWGVIMSNALWWIRQIFFILAAVFFAFFGIQVLISAYSVNDPFSFVMIFFASNLIILISLALLVAFCIQIWKVIKRDNNIK
jgi:hypothetical protein